MILCFFKFIIFFSSPYILHVDLVSQERGMQPYENFDIDEETRYSSVYRGAVVDDSGYDEDEDILLDTRNTETFGGSPGSVRKSSIDWTSGKGNNGAQVPSSSSSVVFPSLLSHCSDHSWLSMVGLVSRFYSD